MIAPVTGRIVPQECAGWTCGTFAGENRMSDTDGELAMAVQYVAEARRIVARQRSRIVKLRALGRVTLDQELTLQASVNTLALLEGHVQELADAAKRLEFSQRKLS